MSHTRNGIVLFLLLLLVVPVAAFAQDSERYIVVFKGGVGAQADAALASVGAAKVLELGPQRAVAAVMNPASAAALANRPDVDYVEVDQKRFLSSESIPYGIPMVQADLLSFQGTNPAGCKVCIIDSGYYTGHEDLSGNTAVNGTNDSGTGNWYEDGCGHGTHVAGTIAAVGANAKGVIGVNSTGAINLHIIKVFADADCGWAYSSSLVSALNACRNAGSKVVSMSLGGGMSSRTENNAFQDAWNAGVLSIAAAGNDGTNRKSYPASYTSVVSVAAIDSNKVKADFSQYNAEVDIAAPGVAVSSTVPWYTDASITTTSGKYLGTPLTNSPSTPGATGALADGGLCDTVGAWSGKVVLCQRGSISFKAKVDNVAAGGGIGAVIYNNASGGFAGTCDDGTGTSCSKPSITISMEDGDKIKASGTDFGASSTLVSQTTKPASGYEAWNGTSMATPHVSGVAALVWSYNTAWTNAQIREALEKTAQDLGAAGRDDSYGHGLVQAKAAYDYAVTNFGTGGGETGGGGGTTGDTTAPVISGVNSVITNAKNGSFSINWTTDEASNSEVTFTKGATGTYTDANMVTSHSMGFRGSKGVLYEYYVSSTDAAGNKATSGPHLHQN